MSSELRQGPAAGGRFGLPRDRRWRPHGQGLLPVLPDEALYERMERFVFDTYTGAPPAVEAAWGVGRVSEKQAAVWRILLVMAHTGLNLQWDILDAEQDLWPFTDRQAEGKQAWRQKNALGLLHNTHQYIERTRCRIGNVHCVWLRLTVRARALLAEAGVEAVESDWDRMRAHHDPHGVQDGHSIHCMMAARLARGRGWDAMLMPDEQPAIDLRLWPPDGDPIYVECEARAPQRTVRRLRKWRRLSRLQGFCAVVATRRPALEDLAGEIRLAYRFPCVGADLRTLIQDPNVLFWQVDDRQNPHHREQINNWRRSKGLPPLGDD